MLNLKKKSGSVILYNNYIVVINDNDRSIIMFISPRAGPQNSKTLQPKIISTLYKINIFIEGFTPGLLPQIIKNSKYKKKVNQNSPYCYCTKMFVAYFKTIPNLN